MRDLALDPVTGDLLVQSGRARLTTSVNAEDVIQRITIRLRLWQGEYCLDTNAGVPYIQVLGVKGAEDRIARMIRKVVETTPGVASLDSFTMTAGSDRVGTVTFSGHTSSGIPFSVDNFVIGAV